MFARPLHLLARKLGLTAQNTTAQHTTAQHTTAQHSTRIGPSSKAPRPTSEVESVSEVWEDKGLVMVTREVHQSRSDALEA